MDSKMKKIVLLAIVAVCIALIVVWIVTSSPKEETYDYEGYIIDIRQAADGQALTTINANGQSEFVVKRNTKKIYKGETETINIGDCIHLSTTKNSETDIKKLMVFSGFSMDGKIVNVEGEDAPFLITTTSTSAIRLYKLIPAEGSISAMPTGTQVKIYYQYPLNNSTTQVVADVIQPLSDTTIPLTENELFLIEKVQGYTLKGAKAE